MQDLPAVGLEPLASVIGEREIGRAVDRYAVVVVETDELPESEVTGEGRGLVRDPFHHVAVTADEVRAVIDDFVAGLVVDRREVRFGERHSDCVRYALAEGTGCSFHSRCVTILRVTWRATPPLPELLEIVEGETVAGEIEARVQQHRRVARRE